MAGFGTSEALGNFGTGAGGLAGLLGAYQSATDPNRTDFQKAAGAAGGALQAANAGSQLAGMGGIPGAGYAGLALNIAGGAPQESIASSLASTVGSTISGAALAPAIAAGLLPAAASGVGALVAVPAILGALTRMGSDPYDREGLRQLQLDALTPQILGPSIASGDTPDPEFIRSYVNNVPLMSLYLGTTPDNLAKLAKDAHDRSSGIHANETMAHWVGPDNRHQSIYPVQDGLAKLLNPENIPRWNPLYAGGMTYDEGGGSTLTTLQEIAKATDEYQIREKNRREAAAFGLPDPYEGT